MSNPNFNTWFKNQFGRLPNFVRRDMFQNKVRNIEALLALARLELNDEIILKAEYAAAYHAWLAAGQNLKK
jgi:hypothetical protein